MPRPCWMATPSTCNGFLTLWPLISPGTICRIAMSNANSRSRIAQLQALRAFGSGGATRACDATGARYTTHTAAGPPPCKELEVCPRDVGSFLPENSRMCRWNTSVCRRGVRFLQEALEELPLVLPACRVTVHGLESEGLSGNPWSHFGPMVISRSSSTCSKVATTRSTQTPEFPHICHLLYTCCCCCWRSILT